VDPIGDSPSQGPGDAKVTIVAFLDYECPDSAASMMALHRLVNESPDLRLVVKQLPMPKLHPNSVSAALALEAARQQGKFWSYAEILLAHQSDFSQQRFEQWARGLGLNRSAFRAAMTAERARQSIESDGRMAEVVGAIDSPTFFVGEQRLSGRVAYETFRDMVEEERARADRELNRKLLENSAPAAELHE
jgi:protein-disulfide isomerase